MTRGHLVLSGRAAEFEGELPFGLFADALDDWLVLLLGFRPAQVSPIVRTALAAAMNDHGSVRLDLVALSTAAPASCWAMACLPGCATSCIARAAAIRLLAPARPP